MSGVVILYVEICVLSIEICMDLKFGFEKKGYF